MSEKFDDVIERYDRDHYRGNNIVKLLWLESGYDLEKLSTMVDTGIFTVEEYREFQKLRGTSVAYLEEIDDMIEINKSGDQS